MTAHYSASVIVPTFNRSACVERLLQAMTCQTLAADQYEVIVSIDGSEDGTRELVAAFPAAFSLRALWHPNSGRASACNAGIRAAAGDLVILLDDDMEPVPGFLDAHLTAHTTGARRGVLGAVPVAIGAQSRPVARYIAHKFEEHQARLAQPGYDLKLRDFYSGNFSIRRETLLSVGLFDEAFREYGNEDLELFVRLRASGVQVIYSRDAQALQHYTKDAASLGRDRYSAGRTAVLLVCKHPEVVPNLALSSFHQRSRQWRLARGLLLMASQLWDGTMDCVMRSIGLLERIAPGQVNLVYSFAMDYAFWLGARSAQRQGCSPEPALQPRQVRGV